MNKAVTVWASNASRHVFHVKDDQLASPPQSRVAPDARRACVAPNLVDVSETMLWALHNRAGEARREDAVLVDPDSLRIHGEVDYDFTRQFGDPLGSLAVRATAIDKVLREWLERNPKGTVVSLGEGLETQVRRVDNGEMRWLSVDLPDAIRLRERFLKPTGRFRHVEGCAVECAWIDAVDPSFGVFIVAQGLLMYLDTKRVRRLFSNVAERFPASEMVFDTVPRWFSRLTLMGLWQTPHYRLPPMAWGIDRHEIEPSLRRWIPSLSRVTHLEYRAPRGLPLLLSEMMDHVPVVRNGVPSLVHLTIGAAAPAAGDETGPAIAIRQTP